jgi:hypothetical protein
MITIKLRVREGEEYTHKITTQQHTQESQRNERKNTMSLEQLKTGAWISLQTHNYVDAMNQSVGVLLVCLGTPARRLGAPFTTPRPRSRWLLHKEAQKLPWLRLH